ncbi:MAG: ATP-binding protein [Methanobrevibacter sp.]|nr:ATP-binding protein [Methanobrevibacter sp.]
MGAVLIEGPKWCGKTTTAIQQSKSILELEDPDKTESLLKLADIKPSKLLEGKNPRLIDEWQMAPKLWDAVRYSVDKRGGEGLYILTGSTTADESKKMHTGTGRIHRMKMLPMSLYESKESNGKISLKDLFYKKDLDIDGIKSNLTVEDIVFASCRGGWPESLNKKTPEQQLFVARYYIKNICESDTSTIDGVTRDPERVRAILLEYARSISQLTKHTKMISEISENYGNITEQTFYSYLNVLKRLYVIDNVKAWSPNIRSSSKIKKTEKKEFIDPSIAVALLETSPEHLIFDTNTFGFIYETLCIRDLKVYSSSMGGKILYYNDGTLEVDCVVQLNNGDYGLIEIKLGSEEIEKGAKNLLKLEKIIKEKKKEGKVKIKEPNFLAILTGGEMAYTRKDGVKVIPIGCLR